MKKILFLVLIIFIFTSCQKDEEINLDQPNDKEDTQGPTTSEENTLEKAYVTKVYELKMRREFPYPFDAYVLRLSNQKYYYVTRFMSQSQVFVGDYVEFQTYKLLPDEISKLKILERKSASLQTKNIIATDPTEAIVIKTFDLGVRYSFTFVPVKSTFVLLEDKLIYTKSYKLNTSLKQGDKIVYNVYRLFPNEILAIKKI